jgi:hypothetical protein
MIASEDIPAAAVDPEDEDSAPLENEEAKKLFEAIKTREAFFEKGWWKHAETATNLYNSEKEDPANPYNILYSNTEVLKPSLYSATPKPDVRTRFLEQPSSPLTQLAENFLVVFSDPANPGEESFDNSLDESVLSALVSGLGFVRIRHYPEKNIPICTESGTYKGLIWPAGNKWGKLPWIAFRQELTREEFFTQLGIPAEERQNLTADDPTEEPEGQSKTLEKTLVYECWERGTKTVHYLCEDWKGVLVKSEADPMQLHGFFPTPGLLQMTHKPGRLLPTPLYQYYRNQAEELNRVTARLNKVLSAIKVRGAYNSLLGDDLAKLLSDDDMENKLVPGKEAGLMTQAGGFDKQIWLLPLEALVAVATQLYQARVQIKQVIYEITGLSDIIRGSSVASETATAQNLKNKWGSIRLRDMQKSTASYVRDLYRLAIDAAAALVPAQQWKLITNSQVPLAAEKDAAVQQLQYDAMKAQLMAAQMPPPGMPGMPPAPPPPPPNPELVKIAQSPSLEELISQLKNDANRAFFVNVQSDSTIDLDTATDKAEVSEFMTAMGQLLQGLQPLAQLGPSGINASKEIVIAVCQRFKFGLQIVDSIKAIEPPPPQATGPTPEQEKKEKELVQAEDKIKAEVQKLEDIKRDIQVQQKEFAAEIKIFKAEQQAAQAVQAAQDSAKKATFDADVATKSAQLQTKELSGMQHVRSRAQQERDRNDKASTASSGGQNDTDQKLEKVIQSLSSVIQDLSSPPQFQRGSDGKIASVRKGSKQFTVNRGPDGNIISLQ